MRETMAMRKNWENEIFIGENEANDLFLLSPEK